MSFVAIEIEQKGHVGILRLNDPERLNAVSVRMIEEAGQGLDVLVQSCRAIIVTGVGRAFCSGANLGEGLDQAGADSDFGLTLETHMNPLMGRLRDLQVPWITAVRGAAAGVGCSIALAGDMIVASENAYFLQAFSRIGLVPDGGSSHLLVRSIGRPRAMEMMLLGERIPALRALEWGLINQVVADDQLETVALVLAERLANGPSSLSQTRRMVWDAIDAPWPDALRREREEQRIAGRSADAAEGIVAFNEKRPAVFRGR